MRLFAGLCFTQLRCRRRARSILCFEKKATTWRNRVSWDESFSLKFKRGELQLKKKTPRIVQFFARPLKMKTFDLNFFHFFFGFSFSLNFRLDGQSTVQISFKEQTFISINRLETNTMANFISSCGGLLGLFMGISILSIVELIYFCTLRLCCQWRDQRRIRSVERTWATRRRFMNVGGPRRNLRRRF